MGYKIFKPTIHHVLSTGTNIVKICLFLCLIRCVRFARYCGKMYSRHLFPYGGLAIIVFLVLDWNYVAWNGGAEYH